MNLADMDTSKEIKIMVYGESGVGKTCFASTFPTPMYIADFDGKSSSAASFLRDKNPEQLKGIEVDKYSSRDYNKFATKLKEFEGQVISGKFPHKTIVVDSLTTLSDSLMNSIVAGNPTIKGPAPGLPGLQHYLILNHYFKDMIYRVLSLPCNVIFIGHVALEKDEYTGEIKYRPALSGKLPELIPILFKEVYRAFVTQKDGTTVHMAQTRPDGKYTARTQITGIPGKIELSYSEVSKYNK